MMRPKFKEIKVWSEEKMVSHKILYDNSDPHLNFSMEVHQPLHDVDIHFEVRITNKVDPYYTTTFNTTLNVCRILNYANQSPVGRFVHGFMREYGNIIDTCPIPKVSAPTLCALALVQSTFASSREDTNFVTYALIENYRARTTSTSSGGQRTQPRPFCPNWKSTSTLRPTYWMPARSDRSSWTTIFPASLLSRMSTIWSLAYSPCCPRRPRHLPHSWSLFNFRIYPALSMFQWYSSTYLSVFFFFLNVVTSNIFAD